MTRLSKRMSMSALGAALLVGSLAAPQPAMAGPSPDECGIWLCLPFGFPSGCGDSRKAFIKRIKKFKPPLPNLLACGSDVPGSYEQGFEAFNECREGYVARDYYDDDRNFSRYDQPTSRVCVKPSSCSDNRINRSLDYDNGNYCRDTYNPGRRTDPHWVDITVDGEQYERYWYNRR